VLAINVYSSVTFSLQSFSLQPNSLFLIRNFSFLLTSPISHRLILDEILALIYSKVSSIALRRQGNNAVFLNNWFRKTTPSAAG
jgi:hypothetical protein